MARRLGFKEVVNIGALKLPYPFMGLAVRRSAIQQTPEIIRAFLRVFVTDLQISIEQPDLSKRAIGKYLATKDQEIIDEAYRSFAPLFPRVPYVTDEAIRAALSVTDHPKAAEANPKDSMTIVFCRSSKPADLSKNLRHTVK